MIDTHCHLNFPDAFPDVAGTLARAAENGVDRFIVVGCDTETSAVAVELAEKFEAVYACVGWHPTYTAKYAPSELRAIEEMAKHPKSVAIGEIGLDYHWDYATPEQQVVSLEDHFALAASVGLPVVFHCRDAYADLLDWMEKKGVPTAGWALHCFSGSAEDARRAVALGSYFGVDGPLTYKNADPLRAKVATLPLDRILLETDAPYMTPHPYRGKPNEPAMIPLINAALAGVFSVVPEETAKRTTENARRLFTKLQ